MTLDVEQPECPECRGTSNASPHRSHRDAIGRADQKDAVGRVMMLPRESDIPQDSVVRQFFAQNVGAYGHPCLAMSTPSCGHLVFCAQMTSFGQTPLEKKYENAGEEVRENVLWKYVPVTHIPKTGPQPGNRWGDLISTVAMEKQSYVNLTGGFWIEVKNLHYLPNRKTCRLDPASLRRAKWAYAVAEKHREDSDGGDDHDRRIAASRTPSPPTSPVRQPAVVAAPGTKWRTAATDNNWRKPGMSASPTPVLAMATTSWPGGEKLAHIRAKTSWR